MEKKIFYQYTILGLVALNIGVLAFFLFAKSHRPPPRFAKNLQSEVIEILDLDQQQAATFRKMAAEHRLKMSAIDERRKKLLLPYLATLSDDSESSHPDSLLQRFQRAEREKITSTYQHFQEIKKILKKEQLPHFEVFIEKISDRILSSEQKKSPPPKDFK